MYDSSPPKASNPVIGAMSAHAVLATEPAPGALTSRVKTLRNDGPLVLRPCNPKAREPLTHHRRDVARVALAAGTAGPIGGDHYRLDVHVGAGSTLVLTEVSHMLVLPGLGGGQSQMTVRITVDDGATFFWWAEPIIAAHRCNHRHDVRIALAPTARMILREEMLLGRHKEAPGDFASRLRITRDGAALYDQDLKVGPAADGCNGAAVLGGRGAVGSILAVNPDWTPNALTATPITRRRPLRRWPDPVSRSGLWLRTA
ncbi:urease accessory protein UreD [Gymnodinialimonas sp. 57CJ19]|uniref:urease accessory protein UreD n=1 Tax=Gymnodinialimonas sp. 57CJ19 TaxID=3138498 RepID=UPI0031344F1F